ncbi:MAG: hypothetical protein JWP15_1396, partial [Alphaproteobacteria bacterium]|nr:hypothetical protein [Alphaproteobacteria bacterium]
MGQPVDTKHVPVEPGQSGDSHFLDHGGPEDQVSGDAGIGDGMNGNAAGGEAPGKLFRPGVERANLGAIAVGDRIAERHHHLGRNGRSNRDRRDQRPRADGIGGRKLFGTGLIAGRDRGGRAATAAADDEIVRRVEADQQAAAGRDREVDGIAERRRPRGNDDVGTAAEGDRPDRALDGLEFRPRQPHADMGQAKGRLAELVGDPDLQLR